MKDIKWGELPFGYQKTDYNVRCYYRDGKWGKLEVSSSEYVNMHIAATCLHYGQESFEGMKAFKGKDGKVRVFRWEENHKRMNNSAFGIMMAELPPEVFKQAVFKAVKMNMDFVPPHGTGAALYIRPLLIGSGPQIGVKPANEYMFMVFVTPVGPYFKEGFTPVDFLLTEEFDRAAPQGTGNIKVGGNYAASLRAMKKAHDSGFANVLFLDSKEKKYIDEAGPANFFGIKNDTYVTPESPTILPSITNKSLCTIAEELGLKVERRPIPKEELGEFEEVGACGTAAVISPIKRIYDDATGADYLYCKDGKPGKWSVKLYEHLQGIQYGDLEDKYGWIEFVD
ncbi:MAG: branched-chain amino acid aminotransferase [Bacteroidetes bacterium]|nr:branched-chain amino acid aminotransferase [Bacteroidota bacterium]MBT5530224.1 branched-chain amino acid aminotransferase [Cytophagia bacterium]MBT3934705.1 branched-chain amino acid aminotransferase [Bacteroidota bacterium]MBT4339390.1 branched-chain amino acid aminotransferase [Bacteroidota bacterium]MBT4727523.1 branched-chain amino acid aminotransferase [Bacteroidota bacterium]